MKISTKVANTMKYGGAFSAISMALAFYLNTRDIVEIRSTSQFERLEEISLQTAALDDLNLDCYIDEFNTQDCLALLEQRYVLEYEATQIRTSEEYQSLAESLDRHENARYPLTAFCFAFTGITMLGLYFNH